VTVACRVKQGGRLELLSRFEDCDWRIRPWPDFRSAIAFRMESRSGPPLAILLIGDAAPMRIGHESWIIEIKRIDSDCFEES
jgi:hypothetical protein